jgi:hypothetical protein
MTKYRVIFDPHPIPIEGIVLSEAEIVRAIRMMTLRDGTLLSDGRKRFWAGMKDGQPLIIRTMHKKLVESESIYCCTTCGETDPALFNKSPTTCCRECQSIRNKGRRR